MANNFVPRAPADVIGQIFSEVVDTQYTRYLAMKVEREGLLNGVDLRGLRGVVAGQDHSQVAALNNEDMSRGNGQQNVRT